MLNVSLLSIINIRDAQKNKITVHKITIKTQNIKRTLKLYQYDILIGDKCNLMMLLQKKWVTCNRNMNISNNLMTRHIVVAEIFH